MQLIRDVSELATQNFGIGSRGAHLITPSIVGPILATVLVFNRVYWRITLVHTLGLDDLCISLSLVFLYLLCIANVVAVHHGYGRPSKSLSQSDLHAALQLFYLDQIFYKCTINLTKLSILCLYLRIFSQTWFRRTCWCTVFVVCAYTLASIVASIFQCSPIPHFWNKSAYPTGTCINVTGFWYSNAIYNIVTDIVILASLPGVVWQLKLPLRQRLGLTVVFGLGIFVFTTSVLRMTTLDHSSKAPDVTAGTLVSTIWTTVEASSAVVCACLPMARTPLQRLLPKLFPSRAASGTGRKERQGDRLATKIPAAAATGSGSRGGTAKGVGKLPKDGVLLESEGGDVTSTTSDEGGSRDREVDLELGMLQPQDWPTRSSSSRGYNGLEWGANRS